MNNDNTTPKTGLNITKGEATVKYWPSVDIWSVQINNKTAAETMTEVDAHLIADAFNTANKTGLFPSQLAEKLIEHQWVSVADRMPEKEQRIMVTDGDWIGFATYTKNTWTNNRYDFLDEQDEQPSIVYGVTHWKIIPSLP